MIACRVGALGYSPWDLVRSGERNLLMDGGLRRARQRATGRFIEYQGRHQVLEHGARPGAQPNHCIVGVKRPTQRRPVTEGDVAFGNGPQAGKSRFRCQQVVIAAVRLIFSNSNAPANAKQPPSYIEQKTKFSLFSKLTAARSNCCKTMRRGIGIGADIQRD